MEYTAIGDTVNVASRFSGLAAPGQILVDRDTLRSLQGAYRHRELQPMHVRGKSGKLEVFEILYA
jgi:class 3 adenylate cyclase